jgi:flavin reductase (DIM6/NTAB) family NADH-FMN oxidoreductase RutF
MKVTPELFKEALGSFATGVTVVSTLDRRQQPCGITINAFASVSLEPPLVLFNLAKSSACHSIFRKAKHFTVNILAEDQHAISQIFAFAKEDKWKGVPFSEGKNKCPVLTGAVTYIECDMFKQYKGGDHTILVGKVTYVQKQSTKKPLLYYRGQYSNVGDIT